MAQVKKKEYNFVRYKQNGCTIETDTETCLQLLLKQKFGKSAKDIRTLQTELENEELDVTSDITESDLESNTIT